MTCERMHGVEWNRVRDVGVVAGRDDGSGHEPWRRGGGGRGGSGRKKSSDVEQGRVELENDGCLDRIWVTLDVNRLELPNEFRYLIPVQPNTCTMELSNEFRDLCLNSWEPNDPLVIFS